MAADREEGRVHGGARLLEVKNLSISFHTFAGEVSAVRNVDFHLDRGEVIAIVGESGSGKSVSTQAILGLTPIPPGEISSGEILFDGEDLLRYGERRMSEISGSRISMIFQDPMTSLNPTMKVGNQIREILHQHAQLSRAEAGERTVELMQLVGIPEPRVRMSQYPHEFSGGMRQRAMIAMAMANHPQVLIADEPTTALDVTIQSQIFRLLRELREKFSTAIILITHDLGVVAGMADRIVVMYAGKVVEEGATEQIYYRPQHPYTAGLLRSVPSLAAGEGQRLNTIEGTPPFLLSVPAGCPFAERCDYAMRVCREELPPYHRPEPGCRAACWLYEEGASGQLERFRTRDLSA
jgi:oligopeptide transport system ATP-binding protein